jgi:hypothetical protein
MDEKTVLVNEKAVTEALDQTAVDLINAERSTMWARHNAMLVANSLIFSAIAISETEQWADLALIGAGLFISCVWLYVTVEGWAVVHLHVQIAGKAEAAWFRTLPNPFSPAIYGKAQVHADRDSRFHLDVSRPCGSPARLSLCLDRARGR